MNPQPQPTPQPQQPPPLSQDLASLANILTQIQYDLFDISIQLAQPQDPNQPFNSRIDAKAVDWVKDLLTKISAQLPPHQDPILPVGSQLACEFYQAKTLAQRTLTDITLFYDQNEPNKPNNYSDITEYLQQLINLMFVIFRWSNLVMGEKEWFWKTKDQMAQQAPPQTPQSQSPPNPSMTPSPASPSLPKS